MIEAGVSVGIVADLLGDADLRHCMHYTVPSDDARREAVERLGLS